MIDRSRQFCRRDDGTLQDTADCDAVAVSSISYTIRFPQYTPTVNAVQITPVGTVRPMLHRFSRSPLIFSAHLLAKFHENRPSYV